ENAFMSTVNEGGLKNPYGLAAVAATGKHESRWDPEKLTRTWSDPSESGQPGTSGGTLSWRNERLAARNKFVSENGGPTPQNDAKFFLAENPDLIARLNAAKSPDEANNI